MTIDYRDIALADLASELVALREENAVLERRIVGVVDAFIAVADHVLRLQRTFGTFLATLDDARRDAQAERDRILAAREVESV
jgi:hypothetical protein